MRQLFFTPVLALTLASCGAATETDMDTPQIPTHLNGNWTAESAIMAGNAFPADMTKTISLKIDSLIYKSSTMGQSEEGKLVYHDNHTPARLEILPENGPMAGKTLYAIYKIDGTALTVSYDMTKFPSDFTSTADNKYLVIDFTR